MRSSAGVGMTPPKVLGAPKPTSSVMISSTFGAPLGGTTRGAHQAFDCAALSLITPPNFGSGGGSCLPLMVVVASGEPGVAGDLHWRGRALCGCRHARLGRIGIGGLHMNREQALGLAILDDNPAIADLGVLGGGDRDRVIVGLRDQSRFLLSLGRFGRP